MDSIISNMLQKMFGSKEHRILIIGLDAAGKTTITYKLKLGEVVTTIPTIGFNVETISYKRTNFMFWDVGGCDKIRPLWRHYYQNTQALIFVVDTNDIERFKGDEDGYNSALGLFSSLMREEELRDAVILVYLNKVDLPSSQKHIPYMMEELQKLCKRRKMHIELSCASTGLGLYEGLDWLNEALSSPAPSNPYEPSLPAEGKAPERKKELLEEWLSRVDEEDDVFIEAIIDCSYANWDHYTHLRLAFLLLQRHPRSEAIDLIFSMISNFIAHSEYLRNTKRNTFHSTMTYFWVHMIHYAMASTSAFSSLEVKDFKSFLLLNPQLSNGGLFLTYYSKDLILMQEQSRKEVVLPDLLPLPSLISQTSPASTKNSHGVTEAHVQPSPASMNSMLLDDEDFYQAFVQRKLSGWGHGFKLRTIYLLLVGKYGRRRGGSDFILRALQAVEGEANSHMTVNYFWVHLLSLFIADSLQAHPTSAKRYGKMFQDTLFSTEESENTFDMTELMSFEEFMKNLSNAALDDSLMIHQYYSDKLLDDESARTAFQLPDLKPLPNKIVTSK